MEQEKEHLKERKSILDKIILNQEGDDIFVDVYEDGSQTNFHLKTITYVRRELNCTLSIRPFEGNRNFTPYITRINLLSQSARDTLCRSLKNAFKLSRVNWDLCINQVCSEVEHYLNSEKELHDLTEVVPENTQYLLHPFIAHGQPNMLFGKGGSGKSYLSMAFAVAVSTNTQFLNYTPLEQRKVLFLDYESTKGIFAKRLKKICPEYANKGCLFYRDTHEPLIEIVDALRNQVRKHDIGLVIIDSAGLACGGHPEEAETALQFFHALKRIQCTTLVIAHETKQENKSYPFGSVFFFNSFRNIWNVQAQQDEMESNTAHLALFHRKSNEDKLQSAHPMQATFGSGVKFAKDTMALWKEKQPVIDQVENLLREGEAKTLQEIKEELGIGNNKSQYLKLVLNRLKNSGKVKNDGKKWEFFDQLVLEN